MGTLFVGEQGLVHLLAVADADGFDVFFVPAEQLADGFRLGLNGAGGGLLDQDIAGVPMLEGKKHQIHRLLQGHDEPGHLAVGDGDGIPGTDLVDPQRNDGATGAHNIAIAGAADFGGLGGPGLGHNDLLHHGLGGAHGVDRIGRLVRGQADNGLDPLVNGRRQHVFRSQHIGLDRLDGEELTGRHLLEGRRVEYVVNAVHSILHRLQIPDIPNIKADLIRHLRHPRLKLMAHIVLLLLVTGENADLANVGGKKTVQNSVSKRTGTTGNHQSFIGK